MRLTYCDRFESDITIGASFQGIETKDRAGVAIQLAPYFGLEGKVLADEKQQYYLRAGGSAMVPKGYQHLQITPPKDLSDFWSAVDDTMRAWGLE